MRNVKNVNEQIRTLFQNLHEMAIKFWDSPTTGPTPQKASRLVSWDRFSLLFPRWVRTTQPKQTFYSQIFLQTCHPGNPLHVHNSPERIYSSYKIYHICLIFIEKVIILLLESHDICGFVSSSPSS